MINYNITPYKDKLKDNNLVLSHCSCPMPGSRFLTSVTLSSLCLTFHNDESEKLLLIFDHPFNFPYV